MSKQSLAEFYNTPFVSESIKDLDSRQLEREIAGISNEHATKTVEMLRLAAITSFIELIGDLEIDYWFRPINKSEDLVELSKLCFSRWRGYFDSLLELSCHPSLDDMLMFALSGLMALRDHEVRAEFRRPVIRKYIDSLVLEINNLSWNDQVRAHIGISLIFVIRQENHEDIRLGEYALLRLAEKQKSTENDWMENQANQKKEAGALLGFYHLAEAVILTSKFLSSGYVTVNGKEMGDFVSELRRLLAKSEEFFQLSADSEQLVWLKTTAGLISCLRASSIWVQAKGISSRIDDLLIELTNIERQHPLFSLLPAQQEALRRSLLDSSRMAIVLQMPTSSGKTLLAEFSIIQTFDAFRNTKIRIVYLVPTRALVTQIRQTLTEDLSPLGIKVSMASSAFEEDPFEIQLLNGTEGVIVSTPEKLDLLLKVYPEWLSTLRLVVVDEAHLIQDNERGARLELLLANIRREQPNARLLLLTPFMENAQQIAEWLSKERPNSISVFWRPTNVLLGVAKVSGARTKRFLNIDWSDPYNLENPPRSLKIPTDKPRRELSTNLNRVLFLAQKFKKLGTVLTLFSASPADAEKAAIRQADIESKIASDELTPQIRVAIALARHEFGSDSKLAYCLERGVAFHHSSLSPMIRYLIEDQIKEKKINFIAATSTLAQGMNFPVSTILIHSVHKPFGLGDFTPAEFWNIAGRAGRVGLSEKGIVLFADPSHQKHIAHYSRELNQSLFSAIKTVLELLNPEEDIKEQYRNYPSIRPFIQYLAHAAATSSPLEAIRNLESLVEQSLVNQQVSSMQSRKLKGIARNYLQQLSRTSKSMLRAADSTGLATFSFNELYAKLQNDPILTAGPREIIEKGKKGIYALVDVLKWLPELNLAIGFGSGEMNVNAVAAAVNGWINGEPIYEISKIFPGNDETKKIREASSYLNSTVSQTISWGAHAFIRGWKATGINNKDLLPEESILPSLIQYGVKTPEAVMASMLGIPRPLAEATGKAYKELKGGIALEKVEVFREFIENADSFIWDKVISRAKLTNITGKDFYTVFNKMQGLVRR